jgi:hypothetical protein
VTLRVAQLDAKMAAGDAFTDHDRRGRSVTLDYGIAEFISNLDLLGPWFAGGE